MHSALDVLGRVHADVAGDNALKVSSTPGDMLVQFSWLARAWSRYVTAA
jgi:hypothetical protein